MITIYDKVLPFNKQIWFTTTLTNYLVLIQKKSLYWHNFCSPIFPKQKKRVVRKSKNCSLLYSFYIAKNLSSINRASNDTDKMKREVDSSSKSLNLWGDLDIDTRKHKMEGREWKSSPIIQRTNRRNMFSCVFIIHFWTLCSSLTSLDWLFLAIIFSSNLCQGSFNLIQ